MNPSLENPFRPVNKRATKRLFKALTEKAITLNKRDNQKVEKYEDKIVQFGPHKIVEAQAKFLQTIEKIAEVSWAAKINKKTKEQLLSDGIKEIDSSGQIIELDLSDLELKELPDLKVFKSLKALQFQACSIKTFPNLDKLTKLEILNCSQNFFTEIPNLNKLKNLRQIICFGHYLKALPDLSALTKLEELVCFDGNLTSLPDLSKLIKLRVIDCSGNHINQLPGLEKLAALEKLICNVNELADLPSLKGLVKLQKLTIFTNPITADKIKMRQIKKDLPKGCVIQK